MFITLCILYLLMLSKVSCFRPFTTKCRNIRQNPPSIKSTSFTSQGKSDEQSVPNRTKSGNSNKGNWTSVNLLDDKRLKEIEMDERLREAQGWESKTLSDADAEKLNRLLGLDKEILGEDNDSLKGKSRKGKKPKVAPNYADAVTKAKDQAMLDSASFDARIRGFLELNPQVCSGCGTPFQSKAENDPGFLSAEKFKDHRINANKIRNYQDAIKILYDAGIALDSSTAEELLKDAKISSEIIQGVKSFASLDRNSKRNTTSLSSTIDHNTSTRNITLSTYNSSNKFDISTIDTDEFNMVNDISNEANPSSRMKLIPLSPRSKRREAASIEPTSTSLDDNDGNQDLIDVISDRRQTSIPVVSGLTVDPVCICQRCFKLQQYGTVEQSLRPGWSTHDLLTPERFEYLLEEIKKTKAVVLCLVDIFDLHGSLLPNLREIAGSNPIVIAVNKVDLLPIHTNEERLRTWVVSEVRQYCNLLSPKVVDDEKHDRWRRIRAQENKSYIKKVDESGVLRSDNVHLISCQTGKNIDSLLSKVMTMSEQHGEKVYVIGAANVGKSSFINRLITGVSSKNPKHKQSRRHVPQPTVSNLPGTTLDMLRLRLPNGVSVFDTPGLINKGQLTAKLTIDELKKVIPIKPVNAITLRIAENKTVLLGGLAQIELMEGRPFYLTFYVSNEVKLHPTDAEKANDFIQKHAGGLLFPPSSPERLVELGPFESREFEIQGDSWKKGAADIVIAGLGWVMVTGPGLARVRVTVPVGTSVGVRTSLMPFEATYTTAKFTGGKLLKKSGRNGESNYGWRA